MNVENSTLMQAFKEKGLAFLRLPYQLFFPKDYLNNLLLRVLGGIQQAYNSNNEWE